MKPKVRGATHLWSNQLFQRIVKQDVTSGANNEY